MSEIDGWWDVIVWNGPSIVLWERCETGVAAAARADELWAMLVAYGCLPVTPETIEEAGEVGYARACPDCGGPNARVRHRRGGFLVLFCPECQRAWNARERAAAADRRARERSTHDRRVAA